METKDTVMGYHDLHSLWQKWSKDTHSTVIVYQLDCYKTVAEAQAEISFKAGYEEAVRNLQDPEVLAIADEALKEEKKAGIREVVEWIDKNLPYSVGEMNGLVWEDKKEKWGL